MLTPGLTPCKRLLWGCERKPHVFGSGVFSHVSARRSCPDSGSEASDSCGKVRVLSQMGCGVHALFQAWFPANPAHGHFKGVVRYGLERWGLDEPSACDEGQSHVGLPVEDGLWFEGVPANGHVPHEGVLCDEVHPAHPENECSFVDHATFRPHAGGDSTQIPIPSSSCDQNVAVEQFLAVDSEALQKNRRFVCGDDVKSHGVWCAHQVVVSEHQETDGDGGCDDAFDGIHDDVSSFCVVVVL